jgi:hypothetical protein
LTFRELREFSCGIFAGYEGPEGEKLKNLQFVTRKRLLKTLRAGEDLVFAAVICKVWRSAIAL